MRVKVFSAPTVAQAMEEIRHVMGAQAIIISSRGGGNGIPAEVMAAVQGANDDAEERLAEAKEALPPTDRGDAIIPFLRQTLRHHVTPEPFCDRLIEIVHHLDAPDPALALAGALDALLTFHPFPAVSPHAPARCWMAIGPPGAGKTVSLAKLAARSALAGRSIAMMTTDTVRAGGTAQMETFARLMGCEARLLRDGDDLRAALDGKKGAPSLPDQDIFIDTQSINPFDDDDARQIEALVAATPAHPILVMAAGGDALESADIAAACARFGAKSLLFTRLDMTARLGGVLASAYASALPLIGFGDSPHIARALTPTTPLSLARLILPDANEKETPSRQTGAIEAIS